MEEGGARAVEKGGAARGRGRGGAKQDCLSAVEERMKQFLSRFLVVISNLFEEKIISDSSP